MNAKKKKKKNKKRRKSGKSLNDRMYERKLKKAVKKGGKLFVCESHAHSPNACGVKFVSSAGWVSCPSCGNPYCRWLNYEEPEEPFAP